MKKSQGLSPIRERTLMDQGFTRVIGVDEAGRGPLAGPVVVAACDIPVHINVEGLADSKVLSEKRRERAYDALVSNSDVRWAVCIVSRERIDELNIFRATMEGMTKVVADLVGDAATDKMAVLVDGDKIPRDMPIPHAESVVGGDSTVRCIAAASIIAKVTRDRIMYDYDAKFPEYGFAQHKGYGTAAHREALMEYGPCEIHRESFKLF
jgi:ribonuclease HII